VGLRRLKRFVLETVGDWRTARRSVPARTRGKSVAIVGSGPAGLTAAHDLARAGFDVTVYEKLPSLGGMLGLAIPRYRLPFAVLEEDVEDILALGVSVVTGCEVGKDITLGELRERGFSAELTVRVSTWRCLSCGRFGPAGKSRWAPGQWSSAGGTWLSTQPGRPAAPVLLR